MSRQGALFVLWHGGSWLLTWHAPWCRDADCVLGLDRGWRGLLRFWWDAGNVGGLGFELSYPA